MLTCSLTQCSVSSPSLPPCLLLPGWVYETGILCMLLSCSAHSLTVISARYGCFFAPGSFISVLSGHRNVQLLHCKAFSPPFVFPAAMYIERHSHPVHTHTHTFMAYTKVHLVCYCFSALVISEDKRACLFVKNLKCEKSCLSRGPSIPQACIIAASGGEREQPLCYFQAQ